MTYFLRSLNLQQGRIQWGVGTEFEPPSFFQDEKVEKCAYKQIFDAFCKVFFCSLTPSPNKDPGSWTT